MVKKPLEPYHPNALRSRILSRTKIQRDKFKNASPEISFTENSEFSKKDHQRYFSMYQAQISELQMFDYTSNAGIAS